MGQRGDRLSRGFLRGIEEGDVSQKDHVALVRDRESRLVSPELPVGNAQNAVTVPAQRLKFLQKVVLDQVDHHVDLLVDLVVGATLEDVLDGTLTNEHVVSLVIDHHAHPLALKVERDLIYLPAATIDIKVGVGEHRSVKQVTQTGLVVAVHVGVAEDILTLPSGHIHVLLENDAILRERSRLVGAEDIDGTEVLDGIELLHDHLLARHREGPLRQVHGNHHRKHLGGHT